MVALVESLIGVDTDLFNVWFWRQDTYGEMVKDRYLIRAETEIQAVEFFRDLIEEEFGCRYGFTVKAANITAQFYGEYPAETIVGDKLPVPRISDEDYEHIKERALYYLEIDLDKVVTGVYEK